MGKKVLKKLKIKLPFFEKITPFIFFLFCFLLPTQFGKHFFLDFSYVSGIRIDYLAPTLYATDLLALLLIFIHWRSVGIFLNSKHVRLFLLIIAATGFFALSTPLFLYRFIKLIELLGLYVVFKDSFSRNKRVIIAGLALSTLIQIPLVLGQIVTKHSLQGVWYFLGERYMTASTPGIAKAAINGTEFLRPYGTFSHPNSMAGFFLLIYVFFLINKKITNLWMKYAVIFASSFLVFFSFSKSAIFAYLFITAFYFLREKSNCRICKIASTVSPVFLSLVFFTAQTDPASLEKRITLMKQAFVVLATHPLSGVGLGNYLVATSHFPTKYSYFFLQPVHNSFLLFAAESGLIATFVAAFFMLRYSIGRRLWSKPILFLLIAIMFTASGDHYWITLQQNWLLMGVIFGIMI